MALWIEPNQSITPINLVGSNFLITQTLDRHSPWMNSLVLSWEKKHFWKPGRPPERKRQGEGSSNVRRGNSLHAFIPPWVCVGRLRPVILSPMPRRHSMSLMRRSWKISSYSAARGGGGYFVLPFVVVDSWDMGDIEESLLSDRGMLESPFTSAGDTAAFLNRKYSSFLSSTKEMFWPSIRDDKSKSHRFHWPDNFSMKHVYIYKCMTDCELVRGKLDPPDNSFVADEHGVAPGTNYVWWIKMVGYSILVLACQSAQTLLLRLYYNNGGSSKWMETLLQAIGFPILIPLYFLSSLKTKASSSPGHNGCLEEHFDFG